MKLFKFFVLLSTFIIFNSLYAQNAISIAVLDLDAEGVSKSEARIISQRLRTVLFETGKFIVLERDNMDEILKEQGFQQSGCTSDDCVVEIGKLIGMQQMVAGSIGKIGDLYTFNVRIIDVESGQVLKTAIDDCDCLIEEVLTTSTQQIVQMLTGENYRVVEKKQTSRFYFSPVLGYGWDTASKLGFGAKAGYQNEDGFIFGIIYLKHTGTDESTYAENYEEWSYGESWFAGGEFGYTFKFDPLNIYLSFLAGAYQLESEDYYENYDSGEFDDEEAYGEGLCFGINLAADYLITKYFAIGIDLKGLLGADGEGFMAPYATFNFYF